MEQQFSIKVCKECFNFASSHFLVFENGERESLHGHNYRVYLRGRASELTGDVVFNFLDIRPVVQDVCRLLDHCLLLPEKNSQIQITEELNNYLVRISDGSFFSFPKQDTVLLPVSNISAEKLAMHIARLIQDLLFLKYNYSFKSLEVEVEEAPGESATYVLEGEL